MKFRPATVTLTALIVLAGCNGGAQRGGVASISSAAPLGAMEPQEILCHMGRCTYLRVDKQETINEVGTERLLRVTSAEGVYPLPKDAGNFPASSRGLPIRWSPRPNNYYVLCSATRPTLITQKEAPGRGWDGLLLDFVDGVNFASMDFYVHYSAACHPGEKIDDGFAQRHGFRDVEGASFDLARPEEALNPRGEQ